MLVFQSIILRTMTMDFGNADERMSENSADDFSHLLSDSILNAIPGIFYLINQSGKILRWNDALLREAEYSDRELQKMNVFDLFFHADRDNVKKAIEQVVSEGRSQIEARCVSRNGRIIPFLFTGRVFIQNENIYILGTGINIKERKHIEEQLKISEANLSAMIENSPDGILSIDPFRTVLSINSVMKEFLNEVTGNQVSTGSILARYDLPESWNRIEVGELVSLTEIYQIRGASRFFECSFYPIGSGSENRGMSIFIRDITARKESENLLMESEERYRLIVEQTGQMIYDYDIESGNIEWRGAIEKITGYHIDEYNFNVVEWSNNIHPEDRTQALEQLDKAIENLSHYHAAYRFRQKNGGWVYIEENGVVMIDNHERRRMLGSMSDVSERKAAEEHIRFLGYYDSLTSLPNRYLLEDRMEQAFAAARRNDTRVGVIFVDLDHFKDINDMMGHHYGDIVLKEIATRLQASVRSEDTVARFGGDEFVILILDLIGSNTVSVSEKILHALQMPVTVDDFQLSVTPSIGISIFPDDGLDPDLLIRNADAAMYVAKETGRNNFRIFSNDLKSDGNDSALLAADMRNGLASNDFYMVYQPQVDINTGKIISIESLVRWKHPEKGNISPGSFIDLAEERGLIVPLGKFILQSICEDYLAISKWQHLPIAINVSALQFYRQQFVEEFLDTLIAYNIPGEMIELEITEGVLMKHAEDTIKHLQRLYQYGIQIAIDDFGTGYSSLSYLNRFSIQKLKVDRSFIQDLETNFASQRIVSAIINMAEGLNVATVAEGVETSGQLNILNKLGCKYGQGFYFHRPLVLSDLTTILQK